MTSAGHPTTDVGGNLLHQLSDRGVAWQPLLRTNTHNPNALWFGVYDHRIYHHGAGFRPRVSRVDHHAAAEARNQAVTVQRGPSLEGLGIQALRDPARITRLRPRHLARLGPAAAASVARQKRLAIERRQFRDLKRAEAFEQSVYDQLLVDPSFYRQFDPVAP